MKKLIDRLEERAEEAGYPKNELYREAKERIEELEYGLNVVMKILPSSRASSHIVDYIFKVLEGRNKK